MNAASKAKAEVLWRMMDGTDSDAPVPGLRPRVEDKFDKWMNRDPEGCTKWIGALPISPNKDVLIKDVMSTIRGWGTDGASLGEWFARQVGREWNAPQP